MKKSYSRKTAVLAVVVLSFLGLSAAGVSEAASTSSAKRSKKTPPTPQEETVAVPQSVLEFSRVADASVVMKRKNFEFVASNWAPQALSSSSYNPSATGNYQRGTIPMLSFNRWLDDGVNGYGLNAVAKFGLAFNQLHRSGTLPVAGSAKSTQMMNLFSVRAGAEVKPEKDLWGWLSPFVNVSLLPSWAVFASSELSDGSSTGLLAIEEVAGVAVQSPDFARVLGFTNIGLEIGVQAIQGLSGPSGVNGVGVLAGTRVEL